MTAGRMGKERVAGHVNQVGGSAERTPDLAVPVEHATHLLHFDSPSKKPSLGPFRLA